MKYILIILTIVLFNSSEINAQHYHNRPFIEYSKHQKKVLRSFHYRKRYNHHVPFNKRGYIYDKSVKKQTKRVLRRRYRENILTVN